jgi:hypothetical protein
LREDGLVAVADDDLGIHGPKQRGLRRRWYDEDKEYTLTPQTITGGDPMTEGKHYWEVEITITQGRDHDDADGTIDVGVARPGMSGDSEPDYNPYCATFDICAMDVGEGSVYGGGGSGGLASEEHSSNIGAVTGDRIGVLLDLDAGWMRFFINGVRCRIGVPSGMKGPYVRAVVFWEAGLSAMALPIAVRDARPTPVGSRWWGRDDPLDISSDGMTVSGGSIEADRDYEVDHEDDKDATWYCLATAGEDMTEGQHYWEVQVARREVQVLGSTTAVTDDQVTQRFDVLVGAVCSTGNGHRAFEGSTPEIEFAALIDRDACSCSASYFPNVQTGGLRGNGKQDSDPQGMLTTGDIIGVLVDLDVGWLRFYRNGARYGLGYTEGVTGPLVCAARLGSKQQEHRACTRMSLHRHLALRDGGSELSSRRRGEQEQGERRREQLDVLRTSSAPARVEFQASNLQPGTCHVLRISASAK